MRERGTIKRIMEKYEKAPQICPDLTGQPLGYESCFTAFLVLIIGVLFGLTIMSLEFGFQFSGLFEDCFKTEDTEAEHGFKNILDEKNFLILNLKLRITQLENAQNVQR